MESQQNKPTKYSIGIIEDRIDKLCNGDLTMNQVREAFSMPSIDAPEFDQRLNLCMKFTRIDIKLTGKFYNKHFVYRVSTDKIPEIMTTIKDAKI